MFSCIQDLLFIDFFSDICPQHRQPACRWPNDATGNVVDMEKCQVKFQAKYASEAIGIRLCPHCFATSVRGTVLWNEGRVLYDLSLPSSDSDLATRTYRSNVRQNRAVWGNTPQGLAICRRRNFLPVAYWVPMESDSKVSCSRQCGTCLFQGMGATIEPFPPDGLDPCRSKHLATFWCLTRKKLGGVQRRKRHRKSLGNRQ